MYCSTGDASLRDFYLMTLHQIPVFLGMSRFDICACLLGSVTKPFYESQINQQQEGQNTKIFFGSGVAFKGLHLSTNKVKLWCNSLIRPTDLCLVR